MTPLEQTLAAKILRFEDSRATGSATLRIRKLPAADKGGSWEICGICDGIEPAAFHRIRALLEAGKRTEAWEACLGYVWNNTAPVRSWIGGSAHPAIELYLRDHYFNSGSANTAKILQRALNDEGASPPLAIDGIAGADTRASLRQHLGQGRERPLLTRLRDRRKAFYRSCKQYPQFGRGWLRRADEAHSFALTLLHQ